MSRHGNGRDIDITLTPATKMATTASQYHLVGIVGNTTSAQGYGYMCNAATTLERTSTCRHAIGINQTYLSASAETMQVRTFGISKAVCESTITAGDWVVPYEGISTTSHRGHILSLNLENETNVTCSTYGISICAYGVVLGRALQSGITNTVIEIILNPQLYDVQLWAQT